MKKKHPIIFYPDKNQHPIMQVWINTFINDELIRRQPAKSFVGNFLQFLYSRWAYNDSTNWVAGTSPFNSIYELVDTSGTKRNNYLAQEQSMAAAIGNDNYGICVGTGTTAPAPANVITETKILHGSTSGKLQYSAMSGIQGIGISGQVSNFIIRRQFTNASGATITVTEVTILIQNSTYRFLLVRDVFSPGDEILNTKTYRIDVEFSVTT